jgi:integrase
VTAPTGLRDEIIVRLGLSGVRVSEIGTLTVGAVDLAQPLVSFIGKGHKPRKVTPGETLVVLLSEYVRRYEHAVGTLWPDMPLICQERRGTRTHGTLRLDWGRGYAVPANSLHHIVLRRADQAGLGHVAPHDLRRTAAGILHRSIDKQGAHFFDLLDIQQVLDHADPATTMRSYLEPMNTGVKDKAALFLD